MTRLVPLRSRRLLATVAAASLLAVSCAGAATGKARQRDSFLERMFSAPQAPPSLSVRFELVADIDLPGPLPDGGPELVDGKAVLRVAGGVAVTDWMPGAEPVISSDAPTVEAPGADPGAPTDPANAVGDDDALWSYDPDRRFRARFREDGKLIMQRRCRLICTGWDKKWKLSVPGTGNAPPLLTETRVYFGAPDNRVYALRKRNGERIWAADIQERASGPLMMWEGIAPIADASPTPTPSPSPAGRTGSRSTGSRPEGPPRPSRLIIVRPDVGSRLLALDVRTGQIAARHELSDGDGTLKGAPVSTPDGKILVARDRYRPDEASLMVFALSASTGAAPDRPDDELEEPDERPPVVTGGSREKKGLRP